MCRLPWFACPLLLTLFARSASAGVPTRLVYVRSADARACPEQPVLEDAVAARLGYNPFSPWGDQTIVATVSRSHEKVVARADLVNHDGIVVGSRQVGGDLLHCSEVITTLALAISITLDPMRATGLTKPDEAPEEAKATEPPKAPEAEPSPGAALLEPGPAAPPPGKAPLSRSLAVLRRETRDDGSPVVTRGRAGLLAGVNALPQPAPGVWAGFEFAHQKLSLGLEAFASLASSESAQAGGEVRLSIAAGSVSPCLRVFGGIAVCALGSFGRLHGEGRGVSDPRAESLLYVAAGGRSALTLPIGSTFALVGQADVVAALTRPTFQLDGVNVWRPALVAVWLGLGASVRIF